LIADILKDNSARALAFGADSDLRFDFPVACKTGTSSDFRDNWAIGYTPEFTVGVWIGNFDGSPMEHLSGVVGAAPILHQIFVYLHERRGTSWYSMPADVVERGIHPITGKLLASALPGCAIEKFVCGHFPPSESAEDVYPPGCVRLPEVYREWLGTGDNWLAGRAVLEDSTPPAMLSLTSPLPGTIYYLDPDLPASSRRVSLKTRGVATVSWESDSLRCQSEGGEVFAILTEGRHRLRARAVSGPVLETWIIVKSL